jgi:small neutral amino acid transporter SnatA (MarC family)
VSDFASIDVYLVVYVFLLLLIGIGPKIALVPFLEATDGMDLPTKAAVSKKMLRTAGTVAVLLIALGELLTQLLHFSTGALGVAGGIILLILAVRMVLGQPEGKGEPTAETEDPMRTAVFPLAVPYLLNPAGIVALVTASAEADSVAVSALVIGLLALVLAIDYVVFRSANRMSKHIDAGKMLITEKVFGFLLAALAVQLALNGLDEVGVVHLTGH